MSHYHTLLELIKVQTDDCIRGPGKPMTSGGYGMVLVDGKRWYSHRLVCQLTYGPPPTSSHEAAHSCASNRMCVNPRHLRWATHGENLADMREHGTLPIKNATAHSASAAIQADRRAGLTIAALAAKYDLKYWNVKYILKIALTSSKVE